GRLRPRHLHRSLPLDEPAPRAGDRPQRLGQRARLGPERGPVERVLGDVHTGVSDFPGQLNGTQRIGVAVSSDLMTWNRASGQPIWSNASAPSWAWWAPQNAGMACGDPFVMPDPNAPGQWLMYYTASPASDSL